MPARFFDVEILLTTLLTLKLAIIMRDMLIDILTSVVHVTAVPGINLQKESGVGPNLKKNLPDSSGFETFRESHNRSVVVTPPSDPPKGCLLGCSLRFALLWSYHIDRNEENRSEKLFHSLSTSLTLDGK